MKGLCGIQVIMLLKSFLSSIPISINLRELRKLAPYFVTDPGMISFNGEGISVHPAQGLSMSMVSPPPIVFSERGEVSTAFPMSYTSHPFSEMSPFHDLTTIGSPSNFFNEGLSNPSRCPEFGEINSELQFFQHNGTKTSHTNS
uniref:Uncharacterized protein LOC104229319 isoform X2 n=1 Tax=Nicotiana sylvestris TaxID=4096 RepID=A0A1U7WSF8_NICSY|nr:PREDICTED: uncharacterized protein LOC104229319 isoform X2 [Nicotiana sylvestris]